MPERVFFQKKRRTDGKQYPKTAYYKEAKIAGSSNEIFLVDTGADYTTVSKTFAKVYLDIDFSKDSNDEIKSKWSAYGRDDPLNFLKDTWMKQQNKLVKTRSEGVRKTYDSYLYPAEIRLNSSVKIPTLLNIMEDVNLFLLGRHTPFDASKEVVFGEQDGHYKIRERHVE